MDRAAPPDAVLVGRAREGERRAFDQLVERHYGTVFVIACSRLKDRDAAEDLAQEVFLRLFLQLGALRDANQFGAWAARVARNLAIDWSRRGRRASLLVPLVHATGEQSAAVREPADPAKGARQQMEQHDELRTLHRELDRLPAEQREMVLLHFLEHLSKREIAERLGVHPSTVGRAIDRALAAMRSGFEETLQARLQPLAPGKAAVAKATACVAVVAALPAAARAELLAAAAVKEGVTVVAGVAQAVCAPPAQGFLASLLAKIASGVAVMGTGKMLGVATATVVVGAVIYVARPHKPVVPAMPIVEAPAVAAEPLRTALPAGWALSAQDTQNAQSNIRDSETMFIGEGIELAAAISHAWEVSPGRIQTSIDLMNPRKDFRLAAPAGTSRALFQQVLRNEIQKAWNVRVHSEMQSRDVLLLTAPNGRPAAFVPTSGNGPGMQQGKSSGISVTNRDLGSLVKMLELENWTPVVDETGLTGRYNYQWRGRATDALTQQLGLALEPARRDVSIVVVQPAGRDVRP